MEKKKKSYSACSTERQFAKNNEYDNVSAKNTNKGNKKREKRRKKLVVVMFFCILLFVWTWLVEYIIIKEIRMFSLCLDLIVATITPIIGIIDNRKKIHRFRKKGESIIEGMYHVLKGIWNILKKMSKVHFILCLCVVILLGCLLGKENIYKRTWSACKAAYVAFKDYEEDRIFLDVSKTESEEAKNVLFGYDEELVNQVSKLKISKNDKNSKTCLSQKEYNFVFFQDGEYDISDLKQQDEINQVVLRLVEEKLSKKRENVFDKPYEQGGATKEIKDKISEVSDAEDNAKDFGDIVDILETREEAYIEYPKKSLANLISNDNHKLALVLVWNAGKEDAIIYYYGKSIMYALEFLEYTDSANSVIKRKLECIAQRYEDIVYVCPESDCVKTAEKLKIAFEGVANQY